MVLWDRHDRFDHNNSRYCAGGNELLRIDGAFIYEAGANMRPLLSLPDKKSKLIDIFFSLDQARTSLEQMVFQSVFSKGLRAAQIPANELISELNNVLPGSLMGADWTLEVEIWQISRIKNAFRKLEAVMTAELQTSALYYASPKGGFDTACLTDNGEELFPSELGIKVPGALADVKAGTRCIAFDLPTAAGFHLHRANEAVLRCYFDQVAGSENRPKTRNMGDYLKKMTELTVGDARVIEVLKSLKDLHRNPLMHPEDSINSIDEAISLYSAIRAAIGYMLDKIPTPDNVSLIPNTKEA